MLTDLSIRDYAIVQRLDIELHAGMTCVTGETGAGKSIMLDAILMQLQTTGWSAPQSRAIIDLSKQ